MGKDVKCLIKKYFLWWNKKF